MERACEIGMVGLGVMGRNLALNMAAHGIDVAGLDLDPAKVDLLAHEAGELRICRARTFAELAGALRTPRAVMLMVPAGPPVDSAVREALRHLSPGDIVIDGGNSHFTDTEMRAKTLAARGIEFLGVGISGGEHGARHGASVMAGGPRGAYERVRRALEAVAAAGPDGPCIAWLGPDGAGHYVKMVHNGIEYALMQSIAEAYDFLRRGLGFDDDRIASTFEGWRDSEIGGFLIEITAEIFRRVDPRTGSRLIDVILDAAHQKGTGRWTVEEAMELGVPVSTIAAAVAARDMSALKGERLAASRILRDGAPARPPAGDAGAVGGALLAATLVSFAQGMALLAAASGRHGYGLRLDEVARIWRGGCIIRTRLLAQVQAAFRDRAGLPNLLLDPAASAIADRAARAARLVVTDAARAGIPVPAMAASLAYFDAYRSEWLPANLIQAQRDVFGAHTYERIDDRRGAFHTEWLPEPEPEHAPASAAAQE